MPIEVTCRCGSRFSAREDLAGKQVACPKCRAAIKVPQPAPASGEPLVAQCPHCEAKFNAPARLAGATTKCPSCKQPFVVKPGRAANRPSPSSANPLWNELELEPAATVPIQHTPQTISQPASRGSYSLSEGRVYTHSRCGQSTCVNGGDFRGLCNPLYRCTGTFCASCGEPDRLDRFDWDDTGESLWDYRQRLYDNAPAWMRYWRYLALLAGLIGGAAVGAIASEHTLFAASIGAVVGAIGLEECFVPMVLTTLPQYQFYRFR